MRFRNRPQRPNIKPDRLNRRLGDWARSIRANAEPTYGAVQQGPGQVIRADWFTIQGEDTNHIVARWHGQTLREVWIAKPPDMQGAIGARDFGGQSHEITPPYTINGKLWGLNMPGGVGLTYSQSGDLRPYQWLDLNVDGRQWARVPT